MLTTGPVLMGISTNLTTQRPSYDYRIMFPPCPYGLRGRAAHPSKPQVQGGQFKDRWDKMADMPLDPLQPWDPERPRPAEGKRTEMAVTLR